MEKSLHEFPFPLGGVVRRFGYSNQSPATTPDALNVRPETTSQLRYRGGTRPGLARAFETQIGFGGSRAIRMVTTIQYVSEGVLKTRIVVSATGRVYFEQDDGAIGAALGWDGNALNNPDVVINSNVLVHAVDIGQKLYIADWDPLAVNSAADRIPKVFDPASPEIISPLTAEAGVVPKGCPCIARYRGRLVLAGARENPHLWYMSRVGVPTDWDYAGLSPDDAEAPVSGQSSETLVIGEPITALISTSDNCLIFGCPTSMWQLRSDPRDGGQIDNMSREIGIVSHGAWCMTPENIVIFLSHDGLYMTFGGCDERSRPQSLSRERIPQELLNLDRESTIVNMAYDTFARGVHIMLTPVDGTAATQWFFDWENKAFWPVSIPANMQATSIHARRDYASDESVVLIGCSDGYLRWYRTDQTTDDGTPINSYLYYGPFGEGRGYKRSSVDEVLVTLAGDSGAVDIDIHSGLSPQQAYDSLSKYSRTLIAEGWNYKYHPRVGGSDFYLKVSGNENSIWSMERLAAVVSKRGQVRG